MHRARVLRVLTFASGVVGAARSGEAQMLPADCNPQQDPPPMLAECPKEPKVVVITGSEALEPVFMRLGPRLKAMQGIDVHYVRGATQCSGATQVTSAKDLGGALAANYALAAPKCCRLPAGAVAHVWVSDSPIADCFEGTTPSGTRELAGPIAAYTMVVPRDSPERAITIEEAYFVFGFGSAGYNGETVAPWTDEAAFVLPGPDDSGARRVWGRFIGLPQGKTLALKGSKAAANVELVSTAVIDVAKTAQGKMGGIGVTSAQASDGVKGRLAVRPLAVRARNQRYAFYADSTPNAFDKRNVRDGRYPWWAPVRLGTKVDASDKLTPAAAAEVISYLQMDKAPEGTSVIDTIIAARLVPRCAMRVQRSGGGDTAELAPFQPPAGTACGCHMDELIAPGSTTCKPCGKDTPCADGKTCSHGFCE